MSHFTLGHKGVEAVQQKKWEEGVKLLTDALKGAKSPAWLLARAQAYQQSSKLDQALADAERAYLIASERQQPASRDQMILAQYRRAVILHKMGRFADSDACCLWSMQLAEGKNFRKEADTVANNVDDNGYYLATLESIKDTSQMPKTEGGAAALGQGKTTVAEWTRAYVWRSQALAALESLPAGDERRKLTVLRVPKEPVASEGASEGGHAGHGVPQAGARDTPTGNPPPRPVKRPDTALKVDFYQTLAAINLTIFIAGVDKEKLTVHFQDRRVTLANILVGEFTLPPTALQLEGSINPSACKYSVTPKKIELTLVKAEPAKWPTWGRQDEKKAGAQSPSGSEQSSISKEQLDSTACSSEPEKPTGTIHETAAAKSNDTPTDKKRTLAPVYPTSSRSGPKDWDNIAAAEDDDDGKDVNQFFKQLYANSTPEQQRAMMKSFTESNGTALSTDWNDVKSRTVETHPPEGVEARKW